MGSIGKHAWLASARHIAHRTLVATPVVNQDPAMADETLIQMKEKAISQFFDLWRNRSKGSEVDLSSAPFRFLAIAELNDLAAEVGTRVH